MVYSCSGSNCMYDNTSSTLYTGPAWQPALDGRLGWHACEITGLEFPLYGAPHKPANLVCIDGTSCVYNYKVGISTYYT